MYTQQNTYVKLKFSYLTEIHILTKIYNIKLVNYACEYKKKKKKGKQKSTEIGVSKGRVHLYGMLNKNKNTEVL